MIETRALTKHFDGKVAVDSLTLQVGEGEVFGLLGPNGAGKTTTVRMLSCLIAPTSGEAFVGSFQVGRDDQQIRRIVGILTETPGLFERLSARKNLEIYARLYEVEQVKKQVDKYLQLLGLWEQQHEPTVIFSKGMKQKLAIARALLHEPKVLFLDEPTAGLDPQMAKVVRNFIAELRQEGRTIFLCTHNLTEAEQLCDRIGVLKTHLLAVDTPENLRRSLFGRQIIVQVKGEANPFFEALRALSFVKDVSCDGSRLTVSLSDPEEQNPLLVRYLVKAGAEIQFVTEQKHSLEDVYLTLVQEG